MFFIASANANISVRNLSIDAVVVDVSDVSGATLGDSAAAAGYWLA